jgi:hypothetical protein
MVHRLHRNNPKDLAGSLLEFVVHYCQCLEESQNYPIAMVSDQITDCWARSRPIASSNLQPFTPKGNLGAAHVAAPEASWFHQPRFVVSYRAQNGRAGVAGVE